MAKKKTNANEEAPAEIEESDESGEDSPEIDPEIARVRANLPLPPPEPDTATELPAETSPEIPKRKRKAGAGRYVVTEFAGELRRNGERFYAGGESFVLSEDEAKALGPAVEPA